MIKDKLKEKYNEDNFVPADIFQKILNTDYELRDRGINIYDILNDERLLNTCHLEYQKYENGIFYINTNYVTVIAFIDFIENYFIKEEQMIGNLDNRSEQLHVVDDENKDANDIYNKNKNKIKNSNKINEMLFDDISDIEEIKTNVDNITNTYAEIFELYGEMKQVLENISDNESQLIIYNGSEIEHYETLVSQKEKELNFLIDETNKLISEHQKNLEKELNVLKNARINKKEKIDGVAKSKKEISGLKAYSNFLILYTNRQELLIKQKNKYKEIIEGLIADKKAITESGLTGIAFENREQLAIQNAFLNTEQCIEKEKNIIDSYLDNELEICDNFCDEETAILKEKNTAIFNYLLNKKDGQENKDIYTEQFIDNNCNVDNDVTIKKTDLVVTLKQNAFNEYSDVLNYHRPFCNVFMLDDGEFGQKYESIFNNAENVKDFYKDQADVIIDCYEKIRNNDLSHNDNWYKSKRGEIIANTELDRDQKMKELDELRIQYETKNRDIKLAFIIAKTNALIDSEVSMCDISREVSPDNQLNIVNSSILAIKGIKLNYVEEKQAIMLSYVAGIPIEDSVKHTLEQAIAGQRAEEIAQISESTNAAKDILNNNIDKENDEDMYTEIFASLNCNKIFDSTDALGSSGNEEETTMSTINPESVDISEETVQTFIDGGYYKNALDKAQSALKKSASYGFDISTSGTDVGAGIGDIKNVANIITTPFATVAAFGQISYSRTLQNTFELNSNFNALADSMYESMIDKKYNNLFSGFNGKSQINDFFTKNGKITDFANNLFVSRNGGHAFSANALNDPNVRKSLASILSQSLCQNGINVDKMNSGQLKTLLRQGAFTTEQATSINALIKLKDINKVQNKYGQGGNGENMEVMKITSDAKRVGKSASSTILRGTDVGNGFYTMVGPVAKAKVALKVSRKSYQKIVKYRYTKSTKVVNDLEKIKKTGKKLTKTQNRKFNKAQKINNKKGKFTTINTRLNKKGPIAKAKIAVRGKVTSVFKKSTTKITTQLAKSKVGSSILKTGTRITGAWAKITGAISKTAASLASGVAEVAAIVLVILLIILLFTELITSILSVTMNTSSIVEGSSTNTKEENVLQKCVNFIVETDEKWWTENVNEPNDSVKAVNDGEVIEGYVVDLEKGTKTEIKEFGSADGAVPKTYVRYLDAETGLECIPTSPYKAILASYDVWATFVLSDENEYSDEYIGDEDATDVSYYYRKAKSFIKDVLEPMHTTSKSVYKANKSDKNNKNNNKIALFKCSAGDIKVNFDCGNETQVNNLKNASVVFIGGERVSDSNSVNNLIDNINPNTGVQHIGSGCHYYEYTSNFTAEYDENDVLIEKHPANMIDVTIKVNKDGNSYSYTAKVNEDCYKYCKDNNIDINSVLDYTTGKTTSVSTLLPTKEKHTLTSYQRGYNNNNYTAITANCPNMRNGTWKFYYRSAGTNLSAIYQSGKCIASSGCNSSCLKQITNNISVNASTYDYDYVGYYNYSTKTLTFELVGGGNQRVLRNIDLYVCDGYNHTTTKEMPAGEFPKTFRIYFCPGHELTLCTGHVTEQIDVSMCQYKMPNENEDTNNVDNTFFFNVIKENVRYDSAKELFSDSNFYSFVTYRMDADWKEMYDVEIGDYIAGVEVGALSSDVVEGLKNCEILVGSSSNPQSGNNKIIVELDSSNNLILGIGKDCSGEYSIKINGVLESSIKINVKNDRVVTSTNIDDNITNFNVSAANTNITTITYDKLSNLNAGKTYKVTNLFSPNTEIKDVSIYKKTTGFLWPILVTDSVVTSTYEYNRYIEELQRLSNHLALDITSHSNRTAPILAIADDGRVVASGFESGGGNYVTIIYEFGDYSIKTTYRHLSQRLVNASDTVSAGQVVALMGNTGEYTTGPHLHFETEIKYSNDNDFSRFYPGSLYDGFPPAESAVGTVYTQYTDTDIKKYK